MKPEPGAAERGLGAREALPTARRPVRGVVVGVLVGDQDGVETEWGDLVTDEEYARRP